MCCISYFHSMGMSCTQSSSSEDGTQELCHKYHRYPAPFRTCCSTSQLMRNLQTKWSVLQHRQFHRQEISLSIFYGKSCLLFDFIPRHSSQSADLESLINLQRGLNTFYSSKSNIIHSSNLVWWDKYSLEFVCFVAVCRWLPSNSEVGTDSPAHQRWKPSNLHLILMKKLAFSSIIECLKVFYSLSREGLCLTTLVVDTN